MPINILPTPNYRSPEMPNNSWTSSSNIINQAVPNGGGLTEMASNRIRALLGGMPATSLARRSNAYFGGGSGMPGSDFVRNRGFDLYNQHGEQRQQQGFNDLLSLISGTTQPMLQQRGQDLQESQFGRSLSEQARQADQSLDLESKKSDWAGRSLYAGRRGGPRHGSVATRSGAVFW